MDFVGNALSALSIASAAHVMQERVTGGPYIQHPIRVAKAVSDEAQVVALLHDVLEDNHDARIVASPGIPPYWRMCLGISSVDLNTVEAEALLMLTKTKGEEYGSFIDRIYSSNNPLALEVKIADLEDNLSDLPEELESLRKRYEHAHQYLFSIS